jgi:hypothetical protein
MYSSLRNIFCWLLLATMPAALMGANSGAAMLYAQGIAWLNGTSVPRTSAVFPGDLVQTKGDAVVHINAAGSSVMVLSDSLVKYEGNTLSLEHGAVTVATTKGMSIRAGEVNVEPAKPNNQTQYEIRDVNGTVEIKAREGDLRVSNGTETTTVAQGEQTTRDDSEQQKNKKRRAGGGAVPAASGPLLDSRAAVIGAGVGVGALTIWALSQGDDPASPVDP